MVHLRQFGGFRLAKPPVHVLHRCSLSSSSTLWFFFNSTNILVGVFLKPRIHEGKKKSLSFECMILLLMDYMGQSHLQNPSRYCHKWKLTIAVQSDHFGLFHFTNCVTFMINCTSMFFVRWSHCIYYWPVFPIHSSPWPLQIVKMCALIKGSQHRNRYQSMIINPACWNITAI